MVTLRKTLSSNDEVYSIPAVSSKTIKPIPVIHKLIEVDVASKITTLSTDPKIVFRVS